MDKLRLQARKDAEDFLENDQQYRMGYIEAEQPHPLTRRLSQTCESSMEEGIKLLLRVDAEMAGRAAQTLASPAYRAFADRVRSTLHAGGRVVFSGCGSSGRLSMGLERFWRSGVEKLSLRYPQAKEKLFEKLECVGNIMTGGDYAVIRAVESFEDSTALGAEQARQWHLGPKDLLVGVTATGETTAILGTAVQALSDGASVYLLICADPKPLIEKMERARAVYNHPNCKVLTLPCGPMALTGSTRMQSSTFEQLAGAATLEGALYDILASAGVSCEFFGYSWYGQQFLDMTRQLMETPALSLLADAARREREVYEKGGLITIFADRFLLDVLTDTTERSPTFMTPPFCSLDMTGQAQSWAFVKNPCCDTQQAWTRCFLRRPRCISWTKEKYADLGLTQRQIEKIPDISLEALERFSIGNAPDANRENAPDTHAFWVDAAAPPDSFREHAARYNSCSGLTIEKAGVALLDTATDMFEHLCVKLMLNALSTAVMAGMGRVSGNWMTNLSISNKKLVDRGARIVADLCGVSYERAVEENYYSQARDPYRSPVQETISRLGMK